MNKIKNRESNNNMVGEIIICLTLNENLICSIFYNPVSLVIVILRIGDLTFNIENSLVLPLTIPPKG